ncbi:MAG: hypothetical protein IIA67_05160 [Planctomycetes bacterium]|nr:hypothetical protein [Planctomycetota bacterium]
MNCWNRFRRDEQGFIVSTELVLIGTVLVIGMLVGLVSVRDQVVQEMGDLAEAASDFDQSFSFDGWSGQWSLVAASSFADKTDFCDVAGGQEFDPRCAKYSACISVTKQPTNEQSN